MKGKHKVIIEAERLKYEFTIKRNITVIQGNSATGKTTLIDLLQTYGRFREESGIRITSDVPCVAFTGDSSIWDVLIKSYENTIVFIDEDYSFVFTEEFASVIKNTSNYYVLITRQPLYNLPYSVNEIYGIRTTGKYHFPEKIYNELYPIYSPLKVNKKKYVILVEDEKSGFQFFAKILNENKCVSAGGNSNIIPKLKELSSDNPVIVIADGAAFGAYVAQVVAHSNMSGNVGMYFPESFEWLILKSGIIDIKGIDDILEHTEEYVESSDFFSWERYYTKLLEDATKDDSVKRYQKAHLGGYYLEGKNKDSILRILPKDVLNVLK